METSFESDSSDSLSESPSEVLPLHVQSSKSELIDWISNYRLLKKRILVLSKQCEETGKKIDGIEIFHDYDEIAREIVNRIEYVNELTKRFSDMLVQVRRSAVPPTEQELHKIQNCMDEIESDLIQLKSKSQEELDSLQMEGRSLESELSDFSNWMTSWSQHNVSSKPKISSLLKQQISHPDTNELGQNEDHSLVRELRRVEATIEAEGGATGGWDPDDHSLFLQVWSKLAKKNISDDIKLSQLIEMLKKPDEVVEQHVQWFQRYLKCIEHKKLILKEWKREKEKIRMESLEKQLEENSSNKKVSDFESKDLERKQKLELVKKWRAQKELEARAEENARKEKEFLDSKLEKMKFEEEAARKKLLVQQRKEIVKQEIRRVESAPIITPRATVQSDREIKERIAKKNEQLFLKKQEQINAQNSKKKLLEDKLKSLIKKSEPVILVERDASRLTEETSLMRTRRLQMEEEKKLAAEAAGSRDFGGRFSQPTFGANRQLAVPSWRSGLQ